MIKKISYYIKNNKTLFGNFFSLSILQASVYILPLITLPYLVRILGPDKFGLVAFAQAFVTYFMVITDYGFNLSATKEVSINRNEREKISEIFCSVYIVKLILFILSSILFIILILAIPKIKADFLVFIFSFIIVLGNCLFPVWLFQGMEKMKYITIVNVIIKAIFIIPIFIFIKNESDYIYVPLINSLGFLISGIIGFILAVWVFKIKLLIPPKIKIIHQFKDGWHIFISTIAISIYTISNTFILGLFSNNTIVGYYSAAEKIARAVQGLIGPLSQAIYPNISKLASESKVKATIFFHKLVWIISPITFILSLILFVFADKIILVILGPKYVSSILILKILAFLPFIVGSATVFANLFLLAFGYIKQWSQIIIFSSIISIINALILVKIFNLGMIGIAINVIITEIIVLSLSFIAYRRLKNADWK